MSISISGNNGAGGPVVVNGDGNIVNVNGTITINNYPPATTLTTSTIYAGTPSPANPIATLDTGTRSPVSSITTLTTGPSSPATPSPEPTSSDLTLDLEIALGVGIPSVLLALLFLLVALIGREWIVRKPRIGRQWFIRLVTRCPGRAGNDNQPPAPQPPKTDAPLEDISQELLHNPW